MRPGMKVILSKPSKHLWQGPLGSSPSWHLQVSLNGVRKRSINLTSFLFFWQQKHAPLSLSFAVLAGVLSFRVLRGGLRSSDEDSDVCRRFLGSCCTFTNSSDVLSEIAAEDERVDALFESSKDKRLAGGMKVVIWHGRMVG